MSFLLQYCIRDSCTCDTVVHYIRTVPTTTVQIVPSCTCDAVVHAEGHVVGVRVLEGVEVDLIVQDGLDAGVCTTNSLEENNILKK